MLTETEFGGTLVDLGLAKAEAWGNQQSAYERTLRLLRESPEQVFGVDKLREAFKILPSAIVCMDEGVSLGDASATEIGIAGSGIFLTDEEVEQLAATIRANRLPINSVTYHDACGAAGLFAAEHGFDPTVAARAAAKRLMRALRLEGDPVRVGYNGAPIAMDRDPRFHRNRAVIIDGTGRINAPILGLPAALQLSARYYPSPHRLREEVALAETIAMDPHGGFGERFTPDQPLLLILVGDESNTSWDLTSLYDTLQSVLHREDERTLVVPLPIRQLRPL
ncbi:MAG: hypothetical protein AAB647_03205 [Patescibacteria group bacterium]